MGPLPTLTIVRPPQEDDALPSMAGEAEPLDDPQGRSMATIETALISSPKSPQLGVAGKTNLKSSPNSPAETHTVTFK